MDVYFSTAEMMDALKRLGYSFLPGKAEPYVNNKEGGIVIDVWGVFDKDKRPLPFDWRIEHDGNAHVKKIFEMEYKKRLLSLFI